MKPPSVAAIVLNYNGCDVTLRALESLRAMTYPNFDLVVVDNGSTDNSHAQIASTYPEVTQVRVQVNRGPACGINAGIEWAMQRDYEYLLILNNDIEVDSAMLSELIHVIEQREDIGCVGPKTYYYRDRKRIWSAGGKLRFAEAATRERGMGQIDRGRFEKDEEVGYVCGSAMLVRRDAVYATGLWDPIYHLCVEDADWCMRMKMVGYKCFFAHKAIMWHMVSYITGTYTPAKTFQSGRSTAIFVRRYGGFRGLITFLLFATISIPVAWVRELPRGNSAAATAKLRGYLAGFKVELRAPPAL